MCHQKAVSSSILSVWDLGVLMALISLIWGTHHITGAYIQAQIGMPRSPLDEHCLCCGMLVFSPVLLVDSLTLVSASNHALPISLLFWGCCRPKCCPYAQIYKGGHRLLGTASAPSSHGTATHSVLPDTYFLCQVSWKSYERMSVLMVAWELSSQKHSQLVATIQ